MSSMEMNHMMGNERVCYVHCNFCNTTLAVSVPCSSLLTIVTVRCGHCANLLSVNMGASFQTFPPQDPPQKQHLISSQEPSSKDLGSSSSKCKAFEPVDHDQHRIPPIRPWTFSVTSSEILRTQTETSYLTQLAEVNECERDSMQKKVMIVVTCRKTEFFIRVAVHLSEYLLSFSTKSSQIGLLYLTSI